jgi:hypothetical protein
MRKTWLGLVLLGVLLLAVVIAVIYSASRGAFSERVASGGVWKTDERGQSQIARGAVVQLIQCTWKTQKEQEWIDSVDAILARGTKQVGSSEKPPEIILVDPAMVKRADERMREIYEMKGSKWNNAASHEFVLMLQQRGTVLATATADIDGKFKMKIPSNAIPGGFSLFLLGELNGEYWMRAIPKFEDGFDLTDQHMLPRW